jgi:hypothetical protein
MSHTSLTHAEAQAKANQIDEQMLNVRPPYSRCGTDAQMTAGPWRGNQAKLFIERLQQHTDDFTAVVQKFEHYVATGRPPW